MDNYTDYDGVMAFQRNFVKMALDEYNSPDQNWTDLVLRYWTIIDEKLGGNFFHTWLSIRKFLLNYAS